MEQDRPLESWKEISGYLHCSLRTCQRWEKQLDLPIHRLDGTPKARVFAYKNELDGWLETKLKHAQDSGEERLPTRPRLKKWLGVSAFGLSVLAAGAFLVLQRQLLPLLPLPEHKPTLAILPFENASGEVTLDDWRTALPDLIITDMAQSRIVNIVRITDLYRALVGLKLGEANRFSDDDLRRIVEKTKVDRVATGAILKEGRDLILTVSIRDPRTKEAPRLIRADFAGERGVFAAADNLSRGIKQVLDLDKRQRSRDIDRDVRRVSTASPQAFRLFSRGFRLAGVEKYQEGIVLLQKAVEIDPKFALAYKYLWRACMNTRRETDEKAYIRKAVGFSSRLSERERGDMAVLFYRDHDMNPARERAALERLWRFHPDDRFGGIQLMISYSDREDWGKALAVAESGLAANKQEMIFIAGIVRCLENLGQPDKALAVLNDFISAYPEHPYWSNAVLLREKCHLIHNRFDEALADLEAQRMRYPGREKFDIDRKSIAQIYRGDFAGAERELDKLLGQEDVSLNLGAIMLLRDIRLLQGKVEEAKALLHRGFEVAARGEESNRGLRLMLAVLHNELAYLHFMTGDFDEALKEVETAEGVLQAGTWVPMNPLSRLEVLRMKALLFLKMDKMEEFERLVLKVREIIAGQQNPKLMRMYYQLLGHGEIKNNKPRKAVEYFWKALDSVSAPGFELDGAGPWFFYDLADAIERSSRTPDPRALPIYEKILSPLVNRLHHGDLYARSLYRIAKIHDRSVLDGGARAEEIQNSRAKAIEHYRGFLNLWKDADPIFAAEIRDARERLSFLESR